eukprot:c12653_g1_i3.p1 GENE.c12653_g1_i3~~c12653_g1_i3.p1  ORF type:complete len:148 (+),score=33.68 c12653_g1_i3:264-707(+)
MHHNVMMYGASGLKSDFGGHHHSSTFDLYAYIDHCFEHGNFLTFVNNTCVLSAQLNNYKSDCNLPSGMVVESNVVATPGGSLLACGTFLSDWVSRGNDPGTRSIRWPNDDTLIAQARQTLAGDPLWNMRRNSRSQMRPLHQLQPQLP